MPSCSGDTDVPISLVICLFACQVLGLLVTYFLLVVQFGIPFDSSTATSAALVNDTSAISLA